MEGGDDGMKVTRKLGEELKSLVHPSAETEASPTLYLGHLPKEIEGMPEKGDFQARIKGKVRRHEVVNKDGKTHHNYDLDVHHCECERGGKPAKKKPERKEKSVDEAFKEYGPK
jgi:hypothetical protein